MCVCECASHIVKLFDARLLFVRKVFACMVWFFFSSFILFLVRLYPCIFKHISDWIMPYTFFLSAFTLLFIRHPGFQSIPYFSRRVKFIETFWILFVQKKTLIPYISILDPLDGIFKLAGSSVHLNCLVPLNAIFFLCPNAISLVHPFNTPHCQFQMHYHIYSKLFSRYD